MLLQTFAGLQGFLRLFGSSGWTFCVAVNLNPSPHKAKPEKNLSLPVKRIKTTLICQTSTFDLEKNSRILSPFQLKICNLSVRCWHEAVVTFSLHFRTVPNKWWGVTISEKWTENGSWTAPNHWISQLEYSILKCRYLIGGTKKFVPNGLSSPTFETVIL